MPTSFNLKKGDVLGSPDGKKVVFDPVSSFILIGNGDYHARLLSQEAWKNSSLKFVSIRDTNRGSDSYLNQLSYSPVFLHSQYLNYEILKHSRKKDVHTYRISARFEVSISSHSSDKEVISDFLVDTTVVAESFRDASYKITAGCFQAMSRDSSRIIDLIDGKYRESLHKLKGDPIVLPPVLPDAPDSKEAIRLGKNAVWTVDLKNRMGSGVCVDKRGLIVTNYHVVQNEDSVTLIHKTGKQLRAKVVKRNPVFDLALIECPKGEYSFLSFAPDTSYSEGETVYAIGTPLSQELAQTVTKGIISGQREFYNRKYLQIDVPINHGNSGGPILNDKGQIVGIVCSGYEQDTANSIGFAIPSTQVVRNLHFK